ncbi:MAG: hypothetical protein DMF90_04660 [Acidobacteria bacterium]|nr:MAG: hypothetical protein DMF90_04660 [Acidobacteriota bacterium]
MIMDKGILSHDVGGPGIVSWLFADPAAKTVAAVLTNAAHGVPVLDEITAPFYEAAGAKRFTAAADELAKQVTDTPVDPHAYVRQYESVASAYRVIPRQGGYRAPGAPEAALLRRRHTGGVATASTAPDPRRPLHDRAGLRHVP